VALSKPDIIASSVVHLLKEKREAASLSMNVVAKRAKLSHSMVSRVEHELRRPTLDTLLRISEAMEIELWPLIKEAEKGVGNSRKMKNE
jgi:transcriptional regulator with XRE-family HTH domain